MEKTKNGIEEKTEQTKELLGTNAKKAKYVLETVVIVAAAAAAGIGAFIMHLNNNNDA